MNESLWFLGAVSMRGIKGMELLLKKDEEKDIIHIVAQNIHQAYKKFYVFICYHI